MDLHWEHFASLTRSRVKSRPSRSTICSRWHYRLHLNWSFDDSIDLCQAVRRSSRKFTVGYTRSPHKFRALSINLNSVLTGLVVFRSRAKAFGRFTESHRKRFGMMLQKYSTFCIRMTIRQLLNRFNVRQMILRGGVMNTVFDFLTVPFVGASATRLPVVRKTDPCDGTATLWTRRIR